MQISEVSQLTERFHKAVEQISSEKQQLRIFGTSAIIRLTKESNEYEQEARVLFSTRIKEIAERGDPAQGNAQPEVNPSPAVGSNSPPSISNKNIEKHRTEIQLMIHFLGNPIGNGGQIDMSNIELKGLRFSRCVCRSWNFARSVLDGAHFDSSSLYSAAFNNARLKGATFEQAVLIHADFTGADLRDVNFNQANLANADFAGADLGGVNFNQADVKGVKFTLAQNLTLSQIEKASNFEVAQLPAVLTSELKAKHPNRKWPSE
jgi:hypothetical protein